MHNSSAIFVGMALCATPATHEDKIYGSTVIGETVVTPATEDELFGSKKNITPHLFDEM